MNLKDWKPQPGGLKKDQEQFWISLGFMQEKYKKYKTKYCLGNTKYLDGVNYVTPTDSSTDMKPFKGNQIGRTVMIKYMQCQ